MKKEILLLISLILIYMIMEMSFISLPGLYSDEAYESVAALNVERALSGGSFIKKFLNMKPGLLKSGFCHGALDVYILALLFHLFTVGVVTMRIFAIFCGGVTVTLAYIFVKAFLNREYALMTSLLLVANPTFIMATKIGTLHGVIMPPIYLGILLCLLKWYRLKKDIYFKLAMFLLGLGMWTRIWFFWFFVGLSLTFMVFRSKIKERFEIGKLSKSLKYLIWGGIFFSLGYQFIIRHELITNFGMLRDVFYHLKVPAVQYSYNNWNYFPNLLNVLKNFHLFLTGEYWFYNQFCYSGKFFANTLYPFLLTVSIIYCLIFVTLKKDYPYKRNILFLLILFIGMFILTPFIISGTPTKHFYFFYPLVQIIISVPIVNSVQYLKNKKYKGLTFMVFLLYFSFIVKELNGIRGYFELLNTTGGKLFYSPAIYDLTAYLLRERPSSVVIGSSGLVHNLEFFLYGKIRHDVAYSAKEDLEKYFYERNNLFVFYAKDATTYCNNLDAFINVAKQLNLNFVEKMRFYERDGTPFCVVYSIM